MHFFESSIDIDIPVSECSEIWKRCSEAWLSGDFMNLDSVSKDPSRQLGSKKIETSWDYAANSTDKHIVLWWNRKNNLLEASGIMDFSEKKSNVTQIKLRVLSNSQNFKAIARVLKQFCNLVISHRVESSKAVLNYVAA